MEDPKRARFMPGPLRLAWPGGGTQSIGRAATLVSSQTSSEGSRGKRKRKRAAVDTKMWVEKYAPSTAAQLCVAPKKVKEVRAWMEDPESTRLLIFVGSPGVGKSTAIQVLASELGLTVHEWNDSSSSQHYTGGGGGVLASVDRSNSLESFQDFLDRAGAGFAPLHLSLGVEETSTTSDGNGKSIILIDDVSFEAQTLVFCCECNYFLLNLSSFYYIATKSSESRGRRGVQVRIAATLLPCLHFPSRSL